LYSVAQRYITLRWGWLNAHDVQDGALHRDMHGMMHRVPRAVHAAARAAPLPFTGKLNVGKLRTK